MYPVHIVGDVQRFTWEFIDKIDKGTEFENINLRSNYKKYSVCVHVF